MSVAEIKAEIEKLSSEEKVELKAALEAGLAAAAVPADASSILGCMKGTAILHHGWDDDELLEMWEALR